MEIKTNVEGTSFEDDIELVRVKKIYFDRRS